MLSAAGIMDYSLLAAVVEDCGEEVEEKDDEEAKAKNDGDDGRGGKSDRTRSLEKEGLRCSAS